MSITQAAITDSSEIINLVNGSYRGEESKKGWTTEAYLLEGIRIDEPTLLEYFNTPNVSLLKYTDEATGKITGSVYLEIKGVQLYLGMLSVSPLSQAKGIGKILLKEAEVFAKQHSCHAIAITVISTRLELISWYERRGYQATGNVIQFPTDVKFGIPKQPIVLIEMKKEMDLPG